MTRAGALLACVMLAACGKGEPAAHTPSRANAPATTLAAAVLDTAALDVPQPARLDPATHPLHVMAAVHGEPMGFRLGDGAFAFSASGAIYAATKTGIARLGQVPAERDGRETEAGVDAIELVRGVSDGPLWVATVRGEARTGYTDRSFVVESGVAHETRPVRHAWLTTDDDVLLAVRFVNKESPWVFDVKRGTLDVVPTFPRGFDSRAVQGFDTAGKHVFAVGKMGATPTLLHWTLGRAEPVLVEVDLSAVRAADGPNPRLLGVAGAPDGSAYAWSIGGWVGRLANDALTQVTTPCKRVGRITVARDGAMVITCVREEHDDAQRPVIGEESAQPWDVLPVVAYLRRANSRADEFVELTATEPTVRYPEGLRTRYARKRDHSVEVFTTDRHVAKGPLRIVDAIVLPTGQTFALAHARESTDALLLGDHEPGEIVDLDHRTLVAESARTLPVASKTCEAVFLSFGPQAPSIATAHVQARTGGITVFGIPFADDGAYATARAAAASLRAQRLSSTLLCGRVLVEREIPGR